MSPLLSTNVTQFYTYPHPLLYIFAFSLYHEMQIQISMPQPYALSSADSKVRLKSHVLGTLLLIILGFLNPTLASVAQATELTASQVAQIYKKAFEGADPTHVTVHDPSVVLGYELSDGTVVGEPQEGARKVYCIFGSHRAWAKSYDLQNWTYFNNNISNNYATLLAEDVTWSAHGSTSYDISGNLWAPDVVWNPTMGKWCMYMSVNGDKWYSSIVLLTASSLTGNWTRVGTVVYSFGANSNSYAASGTDVLSVIGGTSVPSRYWINRNGNMTYQTNAIDPCAFFDEDGNLWMTYGSWFGGLYMLRLDASTGLRDDAYTYDLADGTAENATSDPYMGIKVAGGGHMSGEASYIQYRDGRYWLFVTYGGLTAAGGYNMRVFSSESVTGPYLDLSGEDARYYSGHSTFNTVHSVGYVNGYVGTRLMSYYQWNHMALGFTAQGHNSALVDTDDDGTERMFLVYHTRFNDGTEGHQVRVHQLFTTPSGQMTCAPMEYRGEKLNSTGYAADQVAGHYAIIYHGLGTDYANLVCAQEKQIQLLADGTVLGAYTGSWQATADEPKIDITLNGLGTFSGYLIEQVIESTNVQTLCFTAVNNQDLSLWGYRQVAEGQAFPDDVVVAYNALSSAISLPETTYKGSQLDLPTSGAYGAQLTWTSANPELITNSGLVTSTLASDATCSLNLTISAGDVTYVKTFDIAISASTSPSDMLPIDSRAILGHYGSNTSFNAEAPTFDQISTSTGASLSFFVDGLTTDWDEIAKATDGSGFTVFLSCLRLNSSNVDWYEAKATAGAAAMATGLDNWQLFLNGRFFVTISYNVDGSINFYRDGDLMLQYSPTTTPSYPSGNTNTVKTVCNKAISLIKSGKLQFSRSVTEVYVGYAVDYEVPTAIGSVSADTHGNVTFAVAHRQITCSGKAPADILEIRDISGRLVVSTTLSAASVPNPGLYVARVGRSSQLVLVR